MIRSSSISPGRGPGKDRGRCSLRAFVAVGLSRELRAEIAAALADLRLLWPSAKWVEPDNLHLTVKFLGDVDRTQLIGVQSALTRSVAGVRPFELGLVGAGSFGPASAPRVIWIGVTRGHSCLVELAAGVAREMGNLGFLPEERPFRAHLTLARGRGEPMPPALRDRLTAWSTRDWGLQVVNELALMQSELRPQGPRYSVLSCHSLGGSGS